MKKYLILPLAFVLFFSAHAAFAQNTPAAGSTVSPGTNFVALTQIPAIQQLAGQTNLLGFFNSLYEYCVGAGAALAVIMIMWAGLTWMTAGDSTEKISQAKKHIRDAVFGLVLLLSPAIVFGIINPNVLHLNLNLSQLQPTTTTPSTPATPAQSATNDLGQASNAQNNEGGATVAPTSANQGCTYIPNSQIIDPNNSQQVGCCESQLSTVAQCNVQARSNPDLSQTTYCGCSIKPGISMDYYNYYSDNAAVAKPNAVFTTTLVGVAPSQKTQHDQIVQQCTQAGGKVVDKSTVGLFATSDYVTCPTSLNLPAPPAGTTYKCTPMNVSCVSQ